MKNKLTQQQKAFLLLYQNKNTFIPAWKFVGEIEIFGEFEFLSYKVPARLSELYQMFDFIERDVVKGQSGATYYSYKFNESEFKKMNNLSSDKIEFLDKLSNKLSNQNYKRGIVADKLDWLILLFESGIQVIYNDSK